MKLQIFTGLENTGKTRKAKEIAQQTGLDKTYWINGNRFKRLNMHNTPFLFQGINPNCELIIIDDLPENFDFGAILCLQEVLHDGKNFQYVIEVNEKGKRKRTQIINRIICITNKCPKQIVEGGASIQRRVEIIKFS